MVGAPCGVMDQMAASVGEAGCLMALTCQPAQVPQLCMPHRVCSVAHAMFVITQCTHIHSAD